MKNEICYYEARFLYFSEKSIAVFIRDITERKHTEDKLRESEDKFRRIAEQSLLGIGILQENRFIYVNHKFANIGGYTIEEVKNWDPKEYLKTVHPEDKDFVIERARKRLLGIGTEFTQYECRIFKKNGEIRWVDTYSKSIIFEDSKVIINKRSNRPQIMDLNKAKVYKVRVKGWWSGITFEYEQKVYNTIWLYEFKKESWEKISEYLNQKIKFSEPKNDYTGWKY